MFSCSVQQISQRLRDMAVSESARSKGFAKEAVAAANSIDAFPDEVQAIISEVAVNVHGICVPKSSPDHPEYDDLRSFLCSSFLHLIPFYSFLNHLTFMCVNAWYFCVQESCH